MKAQDCALQISGFTPRTAGEGFGCMGSIRQLCNHEFFRENPEHDLGSQEREGEAEQLSGF